MKDYTELFCVRTQMGRGFCIAVGAMVSIYIATKGFQYFRWVDVHIVDESMSMKKNGFLHFKYLFHKLCVEWWRKTIHFRTVNERRMRLYLPSKWICHQPHRFVSTIIDRFTSATIDRGIPGTISHSRYANCSQLKLLILNNNDVAVPQPK